MSLQNLQTNRANTGLPRRPRSLVTIFRIIDSDTYAINLDYRTIRRENPNNPFGALVAELEDRWPDFRRLMIADGLAPDARFTAQVMMLGPGGRPLAEDVLNDMIGEFDLNSEPRGFLTLSDSGDEFSSRVINLSASAASVEILIQPVRSARFRQPNPQQVRQRSLRAFLADNPSIDIEGNCFPSAMGRAILYNRIVASEGESLFKPSNKLQKRPGPRYAPLYSEVVSIRRGLAQMMGLTIFPRSGIEFPGMFRHLILNYPPFERLQIRVSADIDGKKFDEVWNGPLYTPPDLPTLEHGGDHFLRSWWYKISDVVFLDVTSSPPMAGRDRRLHCEFVPLHEKVQSIRGGAREDRYFLCPIHWKYETIKAVLEHVDIPDMCELCKRPGCEPTNPIQCKIVSKRDKARCPSICNNVSCLRFHDKYFCRLKNSRANSLSTNLPRSQSSPQDDGTWKCTKCAIVSHGSEHRAHDSRHTLHKSTKLLPKVSPSDEVWAFDLESKFVSETFRVTSHTSIEKKRHVVDLVVCRRIFPPATDFFRFDTLSDFLDFTISRGSHVIQETPGKPVPKAYFWAHNLKGYDGRFVFQELVKRGAIENVNSITRGTKFMSITYGNVLFCDFLCHYVNSLDSSIESFGTRSIVGDSKLFFPYGFNTPENADYVDSIPAKHHFDPDLMPRGRKAQFEVWHAEKLASNYVWDHKREYRSYCDSDVLILCEAIRAYDESMREITTYTPLYNITAPSFARSVWHQKFYIPNASRWSQSDYLYPASPDVYEFQKPSVRGGRTDVRVLHFELTPEQIALGWKIKYVDVVSMYPTVMVNWDMPMGNPSIETSFSNLSAYALTTFCLNPDTFGIIKVDCHLPHPLYLHHPPLVSIENSKLVAHLNPLVGYTCTTIELVEAIRVGYVVTKIYELHRYQRSSSLRTPVFNDYISTFMAKKDEAAREGNPGKKACAKLMMNSLYGKFLQRPDQEKVFYKRSILPATFAEWEREVAASGFVTNGYVQLNLEMPYLAQLKATPTDVTEPLLKTHACVGSMIAAGGRIILWRELHRLGERILYHDTDSLIYVDMNDGVSVKEGKALGEWENEVSGEWEIREFVGLAPKTYSYSKVCVQAYTDKKGVFHPLGETLYEYRLKGIRMNEDVHERVTMDSLKALLAEDAEILKVRQLMFQYHHTTQTMRSFGFRKVLKFEESSLKGKLDRNTGRTTPFGSEGRNIPNFRF